MLIVNQHAVPIAVDVVNAFAASGKQVVLFTGYIETGGKPLHPSVRVVRSVAYQRRSTWARGFSWMAFSLHYFFFLLLTRNPGPVLVVTNPPFAPIITYWVSRIRSFNYFIQVYDLYPDALAQAGFVRADSMIFRRWQALNRSVFGAATKVFTLSASMSGALQLYIDSKHIKVIHNWVDASFIKPVLRSENPFLQVHGWSGKRILLYSGNMGLTHDLESIVEAARMLRDYPDLLFVFIGEGGKKHKLEMLVAAYELENVRFLPYQPADGFPAALAAADIAMVTLGTGGEGISVPSKTYSAMAAGSCLLVIAPPESELTRLVIDHRAGLAVAPAHPEALAKNIEELLAKPELLQVYQSGARQASLLFSPENAFLYVQEIFPA
jgi:glycosyltransferase involved in cell wall biosynthesis